MIFDNSIINVNYFDLLNDIDYILINFKRIQMKSEEIFKEYYIEYLADNRQWYKSPDSESVFIKNYMGYYLSDANSSELYSIHDVDVPVYKVYRNSYTSFMNNTVDTLLPSDIKDEEFEVISLFDSSPLFDYEFIKFTICLKRYSTIPPVFNFEELTYSKNISKYAKEMRKILGD